MQTCGDGGINRFIPFGDGRVLGPVVELVVKLIMAGLILGAVWWSLQPRYVFVIRIEAGVPRLTKGKVSADFVEQVGSACADLGVSRGWVGGVQRGRRLGLAFSHGIPPTCRQRLRNLWALQG